MNATTTPALFPLITVVGTRALKAEQSWFEGEGRGYVREFIVKTGERFCTACNEAHDLEAFPTFSVPRANGETRGRVCRSQVKAARARRARTAPARKALAAKRAAAKAAQVAA